jgi:hypothetical protein
MYIIEKTSPTQLQTLTLRAEIWKEKPIEQQEFAGDCESKIVGMQGITKEQLELAIRVIFPDWKLFCIWEVQPEEF